MCAHTKKSPPKAEIFRNRHHLAPEVSCSGLLLFDDRTTLQNYSRDVSGRTLRQAQGNLFEITVAAQCGNPTRLPQTTGTYILVHEFCSASGYHISIRDFLVRKPPHLSLHSAITLRLSRSNVMKG